jgi:MFS family permease
MLHAFLTRYRASYAGLPREAWLLSLAIFINRCGTMVMPFLTIYLTSRLGMTEAAAGRLISVYGVGSICGAYLSGRWCERIGPVRLQIACFFLAAPGYVLIGVWDTWPGVAASIFFLSVVNEAVRPANATAITRLTTPENRTRAFSLQRLAANLGFSFGPVIGGFLAQRNFSLLFLVDGATTLVAAIVLLRFFGWRRLAPAVHDSQQRVIHASPLRDRAFVGFLLLTMLSTMVFLQFGSTYPLYLRDHFGMNEPQIGLMFAVNTTIIVAFEMLLIDAVQRWSLVGTIAWGSFLSCVGFGMLPLGSSGSYAVLAMAVVTVGEMLTFPLASAYVAGRGPRGAESLYNGWYMVINAVAWVLGPAIGSAIYGANPDAVWYASLGVGVAVLAGFRVLASRAGDQRVGAAEQVEASASAIGPPAEVTLDQVAPVGS